MKGITILENLQRLTEKTTVTLAPGPISLSCGRVDARAAELLAWMMDRWPELRQGESIDILNAAIWWDTLICGMYDTMDFSDDDEWPEGPIDDYDIRGNGG